MTRHKNKEDNMVYFVTRLDKIENQKLYPIPYNIYPIPFTAYPILCTLYPTLYT